MSKSAVSRLDTLDDRREVVTSLLNSLSVDDRISYLEWVCEFAWLSRPEIRRAVSSLRPDYAAMGSLLRECRKGCITSLYRLSNQVWTDLFHLCHQFGVDYLACVVELENRAKGREPTPAAYAAEAATIVARLPRAPHVPFGPLPRAAARR